MSNEEAPPEDDPEPMPMVVKNIGEVVVRRIPYGEFEHDDFIDGLQGRLSDYPEDAP